MTAELLIQHGGALYAPAVEEGIQWTTDRVGVPGSLNFALVQDGMEVEEGDAVRLQMDGQKVFYGFVFTKRRSKDSLVRITAYDQLRYLKNKDTYVYENKTAAQLLQMIAEDFGLRVGTLEPTSYVIPSRVEDNVTLFDMIQNALDLELQHRQELFVLYDDFGALTLRNIASMKLPLLLGAGAMEDYDYGSSIDSASYNKIKLAYDNGATGQRDIYIAQDSGNIAQWGVLQYYDKLQQGENGAAKADALLKLYNSKTRSLQLRGCLGDVACRAGTLPIVRLNLGDVTLQNHMLVEKAIHTFNHEQHLMDLVLRGGEFLV